MNATLKTVSNTEQTLGFFAYGSFSCVTVDATIPLVDVTDDTEHRLVWS